MLHAFVFAVLQAFTLLAAPVGKEGGSGWPKQLSEGTQVAVLGVAQRLRSCALQGASGLSEQNPVRQNPSLPKVPPLVTQSIRLLQSRICAGLLLRMQASLQLLNSVA